MSALAAGCGSSAPQAGTTSVAVSSTAATGAPKALQFTAPQLGGGTFDGAALGGRPVVFWFWAPT
jgi:hypothetical protein